MQRVVVDGKWKVLAFCIQDIFTQIGAYVTIELLRYKRSYKLSAKTLAGLGLLYGRKAICLYQFE